MADMHGAGQFVDRICSGREDIRVLAADGSSADLFNHALSFGAEALH